MLVKDHFHFGLWGPVPASVMFPLWVGGGPGRSMAAHTYPSYQMVWDGLDVVVHIQQCLVPAAYIECGAVVMVHQELPHHG